MSEGAVIPIQPVVKRLWLAVPVGTAFRVFAEETDLEVTFEPEAEGCRMVLTQGGWERQGAQAEAQREAYESGWDEVLERYAECALSAR